MKSAQQGYSTPGQAAQSSLQHHDGLPFTGLDVWPVAAVAVLLLCVGGTLRRLTRPQEH